MIYLTCEKTLLDKGYNPVYNSDVWCFKNEFGSFIYLKYIVNEDLYVFGFPLTSGGTYVSYYDDKSLFKLEKYVEDIVFNYL